MAEVEDYASGKILTHMKQAFSVYKSAKEPLTDSHIGELVLKELTKFEPRKIGLGEASRFIEESDRCAVGERVCNALHRKAEFAESVFLDELAEGMVEAGKAK